jgi:hypothetical protein
MNILQPLINDLREKRLWPIVLVLIVALVAVPVLLAKPAPKPQPAIAAGPGVITSPISGLPVVELSSTPQFSHLPGPGRDPFTQQTTTTSTTSQASSVSSTSGGAASTTGTHGSGSSTGSGAGGGGTGTNGSTTTTTQTSTTQTTTPVPVPPGLTRTESYEVALAMTSANGGLNTIDPVERLSPLPSAKQPLLLELGVLKGGSEVLFVVMPGTILSGPAKCLPGKVDCQLISLAPNQIESVYTSGASGPTHVSDFAVTAIRTTSHKTVAEADKARRQVSKTGQKLINGLKYDALSLFPYEPGVGAIVDQRNLTAGGS